MSASDLLTTWTAWFEGLGDGRFEIVRVPLARALGERRYAELPSLSEQVCRAMISAPQGARSEIGPVFVVLEELVHSLRPTGTRAEVPASALIAIVDLVNAFASVGSPLPHVVDVIARAFLADLQPDQLAEEDRMRGGLAALAFGDLGLTRRFDTSGAGTLHEFLEAMSGKRDPLLYPKGWTVMPIFGRALKQEIGAATVLWLGRLVYREVMGKPAGEVVRETRGYVEDEIQQDEQRREAKARGRAEEEAAAFEFPYQALVAGGTFRITQKLRGFGTQQLWRAARLSDGREALVAFDIRLSRTSIDVMRAAAAARPAINVAFAFAGEVDPPHPGGHWLCVEVADRGTWLPELIEGVISPAQAIDVARSAGRLLARAVDDGIVLPHVRPEYMWGVRDGQRIDVIAASDRCHQLLGRKPYDLPTWPLFERNYAAPEAEYAPTDRSLVYSLARMLADWCGGAPTAIAELLELAQSDDPAARPSLAGFLAQLDAAAR